MKTFDEAIKLISCPLTEEEFKSEIPSPSIKALIDRGKRYESLIIEAKKSEETKKLMFVLLSMLVEETELVENVLLAAFITGLIIGIEMEKEDKL